MNCSVAWWTLNQIWFFCGSKIILPKNCTGNGRIHSKHIIVILMEVNSEVDKLVFIVCDDNNWLQCEDIVVLCVLLVEMLTQSTSTTRRLPTPVKTWLPLTTLFNGAYKPTQLTSSLSTVSVSPTSSVINSEGTPADSDNVWVHVGVGIAALIVVVVIGILVSMQSSCAVQCSLVFCYITWVTFDPLPHQKCSRSAVFKMLDCAQSNCDWDVVHSCSCINDYWFVKNVEKHYFSV